jgi:hypothetical protein
MTHKHIANIIRWIRQYDNGKHKDDSDERVIFAALQHYKKKIYKDWKPLPHQFRY